MAGPSVDLNLLGGLTVRSLDGSEIVFPTRKARLLLTFLASPPGRAHQRNKLIGLLWSGRAEEQARGSLRNALSALRSALGQGALIVDSDAVTLAPDAVSVDMLTFEELAGEASVQSLRKASAMYGGDLLEGVSVDEPAFEDWLSYERNRLRTLAQGVLRGLIEYNVQAQDFAAALETAHQLLAIDPLQEDTHRSLMRLYAASGQRSMALQQYERCRSLLAEQLDVQPTAESSRLAQDIRRLEPETFQTPPPTANEDRAVERDPDVASRQAAAEAAGALDNTPLLLPDKPSIAILPFENMSGDVEQEYFADGIAEDVITALSRFRSLFVIARNSSFTYKGRAVDIAQVARELGVRYVVEGSVRKAGNRVRITAQLIDAASGNHLWADRFDGNLDDVFDLQDQITEQIVVAVEPEISARERERARRKPPESLDAWELLQRGLSHFYRVNKTDRAEAIRLFREAVALDPEFAAAHAHLGYALSGSVLLGHAEDMAESLTSARAAAEQAVSLDPNEPMGHYALGRALMLAGEVEMGIGGMRTAIAINPNYAGGHHGLGWACHRGAGQAEQALPHFDTALRLSPRDPLRWRTLMVKGWALRVLGRHDEAIAHCRQACQIPGSGFLPHMHLATALAEAGQKSEAQAAVKKAMQLQPALSISFIRSRFVGMHEITLKSLLDSLRKAGVPE